MRFRAAAGRPAGASAEQTDRFDEMPRDSAALSGAAHGSTAEPPQDSVQIPLPLEADAGQVRNVKPSVLHHAAVPESAVRQVSVGGGLRAAQPQTGDDMRGEQMAG